MKNYISVNLSKVLNSLVGFLSQFFLVRIFLPNEIGLVTYLASISTIFFYFTDVGLTNFSRRILPSLSTNLNDYYSYVGIVLVRKFLSLITFTLLFFLMNAVFLFFNVFEFILISITTYNLALNSSFVFESRGKFVFFSIFEVFMKILSFTLLFLYSYLRLSNYFSYLLVLNLIQLSFSFLLICYIFLKVKRIDFRKLFDFSDFFNSFPYFIPSIYLLVFGSLDRVLLNSLTNHNFLFIHSQAIFLTTHLITFSTSLSSVNSPESTKLYFDGNFHRFNELIKLTVHNINIISFPIIVGFTILMFDFSPIFFILYANQIRITSSILIWDILFHGIFYLQMEQILMGMRKINEFNKILILSTLLVLPIYFILIPLTAYFGASLSIIIGRIIGILFAAKVINGLKIPQISYIRFKYFIFSIIMGVAVLFVRIFITNLYLSIFIQVFTGIIVYSLLILLFDKSSLKNLFLKRI
jgi:O-antigen/teichoic acid export membrane protein